METVLKNQKEQSKRLEELLVLRTVRRTTQPAWQNVASFNEDPMLSSMPYKTDEEVTIFNTRLVDQQFRDLVVNTAFGIR